MRSVPLPDALLARLRAVAVADDGDLDQVIRDVHVPAGLARRLRRSIIASDDGLDALLRDVPLPPAMLRRIPRPERRGIRLRQLADWAVAASLIVGAGGCYVAAMVLVVLLALAPPPRNGAPLEVELAWQPSDLRDELVEAVASLSGDVSPLGAGVEEPDLASPGPVQPFWAPTDAPPRRPSAPDWHATVGLPPGVDPQLEPARYDWPDVVIGAPPGGIDDLPELKRAADPRPKGIDPPLVPGFPLDFYIQFDTHPFVVPALHPRLAVSHVPLDVATASYRLTQRYLEDGELPPATAVRTEEFLAAMDYDFPRPSGDELRLSTFCGPSPFGGEGLTLVQVGIRAKDLADEPRPAAHLVLVVDTSASMRFGGRIDIIRRVLGRLGERLGPNDRVSLVRFGRSAEVVFEDAGAEEAAAMAAVARTLEADGSTDLASGVREGLKVADRAADAPGRQRRIVILSDGTAAIETGVFDRLRQYVAEAASRHVRLEAIDLGQATQQDEYLARLARAGGGRARRAGDDDQVLWALLEILTGAPQMVAADVTLSVAFDPASVAAYRLLGHEAAAITGRQTDRPQTDFFAGQSATALYEVQIKPGGGQDVATVHLSWQSPGGGTRREALRIVRKRDFTASLPQAPLPIQQAAIAAQAAEILRRSPMARIPRGSQSLAFAQLRAVASQVDTRLYQRPSFVELIDLVERAERATPYRGVGNR